MDCGISELDFWDMTLNEIRRAIESKQRVEHRKQQERASFDYILADLIGRSVARAFSTANKMPDIATVYPTLFNSEEIQQKQQEEKDKLSALRFKQFAQAYNKKINKEVGKE